MPDVVLFFLMLISGIVLFAIFASQFDPGVGPHPLWLVPLGVFLPLCFWWYLFINSEVPLTEAYILKSDTINNVDVVVDGNEIVNLNLKFGQRIAPGTKISVKKYAQGYWAPCNVYCINSHEHPKYEIIHDPEN